jgi:hypothetical protein
VLAHDRNRWRESSCEFGIEPSGSMNCWETIEWPIVLVNELEYFRPLINKVSFLMICSIVIINIAQLIMYILGLLIYNG